ncbi:hypothetical protein M9Y10_027735 [Tritrichomonas musculus]|mgnify:CR=1 FL=1|uniref:Uncharacterized protein n=1 Tax=Tritrichomonas musculus TaxID=1915356 RepID=A0ABR2H3X2_9EUKA
MKLYTNISELSFFQGHKIDIDINQNYEEIESKIRELINNLMLLNLPNIFGIHIFLSGGIPLFSKFGSHAQNINDFNQRIYPIRNKIYAIITKKLGSEINKEILEPCSLAHQNLLSPIRKSTTAGLTQIASFLGYLYHQGIYSEKLLLILEKTTRFGSLLVNFLLLMKRLPLTGLNIISITNQYYLFVLNMKRFLNTHLKY